MSGLEKNPKLRTAEDDESLPIEVMQTMEHALRPFLGKDFNSRTIDAMEQAVYDQSVRIRSRGLKFPRLALLYLERQGWVTIVRADLEHAGIQRVIQNIIQRHPRVTPGEIAISIRRAFPKYNPSDTEAEATRVSNIILPGGVVQ